METLETQIDWCRERFISYFGEPPAFVAHAPGRINIIGEHTDYNFGLSMPCAINRWVMVGLSWRTDQKVHVVSEDFYSDMTFELGAPYKPHSSWQEFVWGCIQLFQESVSLHQGFQAVITGNVPIGSGVSSSAALEVSFLNALNYAMGSPLDDLKLIQLCQQVEHQYLHVKSGLLDQYSSQFSKAGKAMLLDFETLSHEYIEADTLNYTWILCDSNVQRTLAGSEYTKRVHETQSGLLALQQQSPEITSLREVEEHHLSSLHDATQQKRIRHFLHENKRVQDTAKALKEKDIESVGQYLTASHISLRDDYEVSCLELDYLVEQALLSSYCIGSRMMGGGFGGCTINLVRSDQADFFQDHIEHSYFKKFNKETSINRYQSVDGAGISPLLKDVHYRF